MFVVIDSTYSGVATMNARLAPFAQDGVDYRELEADDLGARDFLYPAFSDAHMEGPPRVYDPGYYVFEAHGTNGVRPYTYNWSHGGGTGSSASIYIDENTTVSCTIRDAKHTGLWVSQAVEYRADKIAADGHLPTSYGLDQNYPNPFNPSTEIKYQLPEAAHVKLVIYNVLGQEVVRLVDTRQAIGFHSVKWDASKFSSGTYIYKIEAGDFTETKRMVLLK